MRCILVSERNVLRSPCLLLWEKNNMDRSKQRLNSTSSSPREDYNPLMEDLHPCDDGSSDSNGGDTPSSSFGRDHTFDRYQYGVTPPANHRERKLFKERNRSTKIKLTKNESRDLSRHKRLEKAKTMSSSTSSQTSLTQEVVTCDIHINDSEGDEIFHDDSASKNKRRKDNTKKNFTTSRAYDRDYKTSSSDLLSFDSTVPSMSSQVMQPVVDSPRYLSLKQPAAHLTESLHTPNPKPISPKLQRRSLTSEECPSDRIAFHKTFSMLINLGNKKEKEKEGTINPTPNLLSRQMSSEQESWLTMRNDLIWLELQSWHWGRSMREQDLYLCGAREYVPGVINEIIHFKVSMTDLNLDEMNMNSMLQSEQCQDGVDGKLVSLDVDWFYSPICWPKLHQRVNDIKEALVQVEDQIHKLECVESLFPSFKALSKDYPVYGSLEFQSRLETLCLWMNISRDIGHKLQLMGKILYVDQLEGVLWPWMDYDAVKQDNPDSVPEIPIKSTSSESASSDQTAIEERDEETHSNSGSSDDKPGNSMKSVRFEISDSTPSTPEREISSPFAAIATSTPGKRDWDKQNSVPHNLSAISVVNRTRTTVYRYFVDRTLRRMGLRKAQMRLRNLLQSTLSRAHNALSNVTFKDEVDSAINSLDKEPISHSEALPISPSTENITSDLRLFPSLPDNLKPIDGSETWIERFRDMGLPSFRPLYLFLVRIPLDVIHECIRLRLEQRPESEPSLLSVRQLIRECKEVLLAGVIVKEYCRRMVDSVISGDGPERQEASMEEFEEDLKLILEVYFNYLQTWMTGLEQLPEMSKRLKNFLEDEWNFTKRVCRHVRGGEAYAGKRFCLMASSLLRSISDFLDTGVDECINQFYDSMALESGSEEEEEDGGGDDEDEVYEDEEYYEEDDEEEEVHEGEDEDDVVDGGDVKALKRNTSRCGVIRQSIIQCCRDFKVHFREARERASKALGFAKMLRKDLEVAADFIVLVATAELLQTIKTTNHARLVTPHRSNHLMFIPETISSNSDHIVQLLNMTCGREEGDEGTSEANKGYLLLLKLEQNGALPTHWHGANVHVEPDAETTIALSHIEVESLMLVVTHSSLLSVHRKHFQQLMGDVVELANEQTSCHQAITESLVELKTAGSDLRDKIAFSIRQVDDKLNLDAVPTEMDDAEKLSILTLYRETLHQCYNFGFEYHKEVTRLVSGESNNILGHSLISFAKQWMKFVFEKCERGRGVRPRWANQGLDFLIVALEPRVLATLTAPEFADLKMCINKCITHVVGDKASPGTHTTGHRISSPDIVSQRHQGLMRNVSCPENTPPRSLTHSLSSRSVQSEPTTPYTTSETVMRKTNSAFDNAQSNMSLGEEGPISFDVPRRRSDYKDGQAESVSPELADPFQRPPSTRLQNVRKDIMMLEQRRSQKLHSKRVIGRVTNQKVEVDYHINIRRVNFKWQRGYKIGEGQFGKVYAAVNSNTGQIMAMKELKFQPNDHQSIKDIVDEIKIFETISHPSLVKYYGVEVHRDEMLIFMEYCSEGTIEEVGKVGIPEALVRKYTAEILMAIHVLHENGIVHRDIKGANIFLTSNGPVKLGDFGCSVKLKNHTTMPGEVANTVGTTAFMAPEVISRSENGGSGRSADIWSLGCVVYEMVTGKRPWHELENNYQIMFKVGMGGRPTIPDSLSMEGKDFLSHCLEQDPKVRWTASQLQDHRFVKVFSEDDVDASADQK